MILDLLRRLFKVPVTETPPVLHAAPMPSYAQTIRLSPNVTPRKRIVPTHILMHHTDGTYAGSVSWCLNPASRVSYHCIISQTGKRTVLAEPTTRTWHAGVSSWDGRKDCNSFCIGVSFEGDTYRQPPTEAALFSAVEYMLPIMDEFDIPILNVIRHADVALPQGRKNDCSPQALSAVKAILRKVV